MRCVAYCTANQYNLNEITALYQNQPYDIDSHREVLVISHRTRDKTLIFFSSGCFVSWGFTSREENEIILKSVKFSSGHLLEIETDSAHAYYSDETTLRINHRFDIDMVSLESEDVSIKLGISYAMAQSVKLNTFESAVRTAITLNKDLPEKLSKYGRIKLPRKALSKRIGAIFAARASINLHSEFLDVPEYFWDHPGLEEYYERSKLYYEITNRVAALNIRLEVLHEFLDMLQNQLQDRHSSMLELIIIVLIGVEIVLSLIHWVQ